MLILCLEHFSRLIQDTVIWDTFHFVQLRTFSCGSFMGSTALKNTVWRPLFESFAPAIRPDSENRIAVMGRTNVINVFNTVVRDFAHCLPEMDQLCFLQSGLEKHACKECQHKSLSNTEVFFLLLAFSR